MNENQLIEELGSFDTEPLKIRAGKGLLGPGKPRELTETATWDGWGNEDQTDICLLDFGESFFHAVDPCHISQLSRQKVPESIFENCLDYKADLWRAGIIVRNLRFLFSWVRGDDNCLPTTSRQIYSLVFNIGPFFALSGDHALVLDMIGFVEKLPLHWHHHWVKMRKDAGKEAKSRPSKFNRLHNPS
jgi:serine/threonine-protein kinase SRPK3